MKKTLSIEVSDDEQAMLDDYINGPHHRWVIDQLDAWLRTKIKYENVETVDVQHVRNKLWELMS